MVSRDPLEGRPFARVSFPKTGPLDARLPRCRAPVSPHPRAVGSVSVSQFEWDPDTFFATMLNEIPGYEQLQETVAVAAQGAIARHIARREDLRPFNP
jgi:hypothetical protein